MTKSIMIDKKEYYTVLKYLTTLQTTELSIQSLNRRGTLPELIITSSLLYNNVLKNWEFDKITAQKILITLVQDEHIKPFKKFIELKDPKKYQFLDWYDLQEQCIKLFCSETPSLLKKLISDKWIDFSTIEKDHLLDFLHETFNSIGTETYLIVMTELMKAYPDVHINLLDELLGKFENDGWHDSFISRDIMTVFIKNMNIVPPKPFMIHNASIMVYLDKKHPLHAKLMGDEEFIKYLISVNKLEYMPDEVKDIFIF